MTAPVSRAGRQIVLHVAPWRPAPGWLPPATRAYAIGDIHGHVDLLDVLLGAIHAEAVSAAAAHPGLRQVLVTLGDYIDRGPRSDAVLDRLSGFDLPGLECHCLRGNHEEFLLEFLTTPLKVTSWLVHGGRETLDSYGIAPPDPFDPVAVAAASAALRAHLPPAHRAFLAGLPDSFRLGGYGFVHAGLRPGLPLEAQDPRDLRWIREDFLESDADFGCVVVHGHTIVPAPVIRRNRIGLDTGAYATGRLTALVLDQSSCRLLTAARTG